MMCVHEAQIGCCSCFFSLSGGRNSAPTRIHHRQYLRADFAIYVYIYTYCCLSLASSCCKHFDVLAEINLPSSIFGQPQPQQQQLEADATGCKI